MERRSIVKSVESLAMDITNGQALQGTMQIYLIISGYALHATAIWIFRSLTP